MQLVRFGREGHECVGLRHGDVIRDVSQRVPTLSGAALDPGSLSTLAAVDPHSFPIVHERVRLGACIEPGGKIVCVGLNYSDHAKEAGMPLPSEPVLFMKGCRLSGPNDPILLPQAAQQVDWEMELAIVIGRFALAVAEGETRNYVAGFAGFIDVSERNWQHARQGQWVKGKSWLSFAPIGPWLATPDEIANVQALSVWLAVNGVRVQDGNTADMLAGVDKLVSYISQFMPLYPGDVIATGTPAGVGMGLKPPRYLRVGDEVRGGLTSLGEHAHRCERFA
jgi:2-keto-4-pentenoate hydratase/2-oxohepta-3-ene-1,7-dioic acid hydratase in catechol pathway